jgi:sugar-specific transcriptional regulator TrmB
LTLKTDTDQDEVVELLRQLDLNLYEARAYATLVLSGSLNPAEISFMSRIPQPRIYDTLKSLAISGLVKVHPGRPSKYSAVHPKLALYMRLKNFAEDFNEEMSRQELKLRRTVDRMQRQFEEEFKQRREAMKKLVETMEPLYEKGVARAEEMVWVVDGEDAVRAELSEIIGRAQKEILAVSKAPFLPSVYDAVEEALRRGVRYRRIVGEDSLLKTWGREGIEHDLRVGIELRFLPENEIQEKLYIIDKKEVLIRLRDPVTTLFSFSATIIKSQSLASLLKNHFKVLWKRALPAKELLKR